MTDIIKIDILGDSALIEFNKDKLKFDLDVLSDLDVIIKKLYQDEIYNITIDFKNIIFITSLVLGKLVSYHRDLSQKGGRLAVSNANDSIIDVFRSTKIDRVIPIS